MKTKILIAAFSLVCLVSVGFLLLGLNWWKGRPEYSLRQIGIAVRTHDLPLFRKHVDMRSVGSRLVDDLIYPDGGSTSSSFNRSLAGLLKPQILATLESQFERYVETGKFVGNADDTAAIDFSDLSSRIESYDWASVNGNIATSTLYLRQGPPKQPAAKLTLKLRRTDDGFWQLMEVTFPKDFQRRVQTSMWQ